MYVFYVPWTAAVLILHICSVKYTTERAEKLLKEPYTPLPDIMQEILPILDIRIPDKLLFSTTLYTIIHLIWYQNMIIFNQQLLIVLIAFSIRPFFCCLTTLPASLPKLESNLIYDKYFISNHDLMFSGHTCFFLFMGNNINNTYIRFIIIYIFPLTLIMSKLHYSIDIFVSMFIYNYIDLYIKTKFDNFCLID